MKNIPKKIILVVVIFLVTFGLSDVYAQSFLTDSENLQERLLQLGFPDFLRAYQERMRIFDVWDKIKESGVSLSPVTIGIIDTSIDARDGRHPEFENVNLEGSRFFALQDRAEYFYGSDYASGHGAKVAGIIGANNISATSSINYRFPQMNGILSGVTNNYNLISETGLVVDFTPQGLGIIADRMPENAVVNVSYISKRIKDEDFNDFTGYWRDVFNGNSDKTFIIAAGNDNQNVTTLTPQNINTANTIIVGATDFNDGRLIISSTKASNFGLGVDISATGESIYTPAIRGKGDFPNSGFFLNSYSASSAGTSLSAPMVTGVAGLIKAIKPELTPAQIKQILIESGDPISTDKPIGPRLNAYKAVCHSLVLNCAPPPPSSLTWKASQPIVDCQGPNDNQGIPWFESTFDDSGWQNITLPDFNTWGCDFCDRYYRGYLTLPQNFGEITISFASDDGLWLSVNDNFINHWGGACHESGCVNNPYRCGISTGVDPLDITSFLHSGTNLIAVHVSDATVDDIFNFNLVNPLAPSDTSIQLDDSLRLYFNSQP